MSELKVKALPREFILTKGATKIRLADPNPSMTATQVAEHYSRVYPELTNASVSMPNIKKDKVEYDLSTAIGKKG